MKARRLKLTSIAWSVLVLSVLSACAGTTSTPNSHMTYLARKGVKINAPDTFDHCSAYGCQTRQNVSLAPHHMETLRAIFNPKPQNAKQERENIARAVSFLEKEIGQITQTQGDVGGTFAKAGKGQLDCVDESINTTIYLELLNRNGFLHYHHIHAPTVRLPLFNGVGWPHQTALISEKDTGARYVVDSWFHDNGHPPEIIPLSQWREGWKPADIE